MEALQANPSGLLGRGRASLSQLAASQFCNPSAKGLATIEVAARAAMIKRDKTAIENQAEALVECEVVLWITRQGVESSGQMILAGIRWHQNRHQPV